MKTMTYICGELKNKIVMEKLKLEHIAPYLPYGVKLIRSSHYRGNTIIVEWGIRNCSDYPVVGYYEGNPHGIMLSEVKPILRPLSDLTKEIEHNGERFVPMVRICEFLKVKFKHFQLLDKSVDLVLNDKNSRQVRLWFSNFQGIFFNCSDMGVLRYRDHFGAIKKLIEWHFDVFGLIEKGLAIDINTL